MEQHTYKRLPIRFGETSKHYLMQVDIKLSRLLFITCDIGNINIIVKRRVKLGRKKMFTGPAWHSNH